MVQSSVQSGAQSILRVALASVRQQRLIYYYALIIIHRERNNPESEEHMATARKNLRAIAFVAILRSGRTRHVVLSRRRSAVLMQGRLTDHMNLFGRFHLQKPSVDSADVRINNYADSLLLQNHIPSYG